MTSHHYSSLFATLYDEPSPVGKLGRGAHYSILSAVQWRNNRQITLAFPSIQNIAVVWDEDHDTRIIGVIENAYMKNLLSPVLFVGERKAVLNIIVEDEFMAGEELEFSRYEKEWNNACEKATTDNWHIQIVRISDIDSTQIIHADREKVRIYLQNISNLWSLGINSYIEKKTELK